MYYFFSSSFKMSDSEMGGSEQKMGGSDGSDSEKIGGSDQKNIYER